jgi:hypothetical protein
MIEVAEERVTRSQKVGLIITPFSLREGGMESVSVVSSEQSGRFPEIPVGKNEV